MRVKAQLPLLSLLLLNITLLIIPCLTYAKSVIEPCSSSDTCNSLLTYLLPWESKISEIASRFQVNISDMLAANSINPTIPSAGNQILPAKSLVKVPIMCACVDGIRRSLSTKYTVAPADNLDSISKGYGGLVSTEQIRSFNGINNKNPLMSGQSIVIPLPCTCFNNSNNGVTTVYLSYVVHKGESLTSIGGEYGTTVADLEAVNGLDQPVVDPGDILAVPIPACSSENLGWYNESLIVPNGSYALTANNCIKCNCGPKDLNLQCSPSGIAASCSHLQCKESNLFIGDTYENKAATGCNVTACVYRGHNGRKIFRSLVNSSHVQCSGYNRSYTAQSPGSSPSLPNPVVPILTLSPSPSPPPALNPTMGIETSNPTSEQNPVIPSAVGLASQASCCSILLAELVLSFVL